jgi:hypothetical protein
MKLMSATQASRLLDIPVGKILRAAHALHVPRAGRNYAIREDQLCAIKRAAQSATQKGAIL